MNNSISVNKEKLEGIILSKTDYKENSEKITIITNEGLSTLIVRGSKKIDSKLRSLTQIFSYVSLIVTNNHVINTVCEGTIIENFTKIKDDPSKTLIGMIISETLYHFTTSIVDFNLLFNLYKKSLRLLNDSAYPESIISLFHLKLLYLTGVEPSFKICPKCQKNEGLYFSVKEGGLVCDDCHTMSDLSFNLSQLIKIIYFVKLDVVDENLLKIISEYEKEIEQMIADYYATYFDFYNLNLQIYNKMR